MAYITVDDSNKYYINTDNGQLYAKLSNGSYNRITAKLDNPYYGKYFSGNVNSIFNGYQYSPQQKKFVPARYTKLNGVTFGGGDYIL